uniref:Uncharacterized protein n=1 Tax=Molossus molossus TaxID=27622 RepID=A0A7J8E2W7_MOLMO|nr:hypothetical protein HJG59_008971 [Molossus molossus]
MRRWRAGDESNARGQLSEPREPRHFHRLRKAPCPPVFQPGRVWSGCVKRTAGRGWGAGTPEQGRLGRAREEMDAARETRHSDRPSLLCFHRLEHRAEARGRSWLSRPGHRETLEAEAGGGRAVMMEGGAQAMVPIPGHRLLHPRGAFKGSELPWHFQNKISFNSLEVQVCLPSRP